MLPNNKTRRQITSDERNLLAQFACFEIRLEDLLDAFGGMIEFEFARMERRFTSYFLLPEPGIRIKKNHITNALEKHKNGEINDDQLHRWAVMLLLNEAYIWDGPYEDEIAESLNELAMIPGP